MAIVSFARDEKPKPPIDAALEEIGHQSVTLSRPIRCRIQPDLYDPREAVYTSWRGLIWTCELGDVDEGRQLREGLTAFFRLFGSEKKASLLKGLTELDSWL